MRHAVGRYEALPATHVLAVSAAGAGRLRLLPDAVGAFQQEI